MNRKAEVGMKCIVIGLGDDIHSTKHNFQLNEEVTIISVFRDGSVMAENEHGLVQCLEPNQLGVLIEQKSKAKSTLKELVYLAVAIFVMLAVMSAESLLDLIMK